MLNRTKLQPGVLVLGRSFATALAQTNALKLLAIADGLHVSLPEKFDGKIAIALKIRS